MRAEGMIGKAGKGQGADLDFCGMRGVVFACSSASWQRCDAMRHHDQATLEGRCMSKGLAECTQHKPVCLSQQSLWNALQSHLAR